MKLEMIQELCGINEDICRLITDCTKNTFKIKMFIKKLLDISRIESGKITLSSDEIVIDYIVEESVECSVDDKQKCRLIMAMKTDIERCMQMRAGF